MKKFRCTVCGYVHEGDAAPEKCPLCKAPASKFVEVVEVEVQFAKIVHIIVVLCTEGEIFYGFKQEIRVTGYLAPVVIYFSQV
jgi:hypothetical protein